MTTTPISKLLEPEEPKNKQIQLEHNSSVDTNKGYLSGCTVDIKSSVLVFAIILIISSCIFTSSLRSTVPGTISSDGKITLVGSFVSAIVGTVMFVLVKFIGSF